MKQPLPTAGQLRSRAVVINQLSSSLDNGANGLSAVPGLLRQVLEGDTWRHFTTMRDEEVRYEDFSDFIRTPPLKGLGATENLIRRLLADDIATLCLLDQALARPAGRPPALERPSDAEEPQENVSNRHDSRPAGTTRAAGPRRLRHHAPELLPRVESGELSVHGALVQAGLRSRTVSVPVTDPSKTAQILLRSLHASDLAQLIGILTQDPHEH